MITGVDEKSLWAITQLKQGLKPSQLQDHGFTQSQAKKLSQFVNCLKKMEGHISDQHIAKWESLGLKALVLLPLFKNRDWEGLADILISVESSVKRKELARYLDLLAEKRKQINHTQTDINKRISDLKNKKKKLLQTIANVEKEQEIINNEFRSWTNDPKILEFLLDHLGIKNEKICLAKRLDYRWQKNLKKKEIITFSESSYLHIVHDVQALAKDCQKRLKRGYRIHWDSEALPESDFVWWDVPYEPNYENIESLYEIRGKKLTKEKKRIKEIEHEILLMENGLKEIKARKLHSFEESLKRADQLSSIDLESHGTLQLLGLKWLYNEGYFATTELTLPNNSRVDVIGVNEKGEICILECKARLTDYRSDTKWQRYLPYCNTFYFVSEPLICNHIANDIGKKCGILCVNDTHLELLQECPVSQQAEQSETTAFLIGRNLSKRFAFRFS